MNNNLSVLESIISYNFKNRTILKIALQHSSKIKTPDNYERLEFLGDSILGAVVSEWLFKKEFNANEGDLSKKRSLLINKKKISTISEKLGLIKYANFDCSIDLNIESTRQKISSDLYEAVIGAIFLDSGYDASKKFIKMSLLTELEFSNEDFNNKGTLNEFCHMENFNQPIYKIMKEMGPDHIKLYKVSLLVDGVEFIGEGYKIKNAENKAAFNALKHFGIFN